MELSLVQIFLKINNKQRKKTIIILVGEDQLFLKSSETSSNLHVRIN